MNQMMTQRWEVIHRSADHFWSIQARKSPYCTCM